MPGLRLVFAGTPEFAAVALDALHRAGHTLQAVFTQPDRPAGRGLRLQASPVKQWALAHGVPVAQPRSLRLDGRYPDDAQAAQQLLSALQPDAMVVAAYGLILPQWVLDVPRMGCFNIHASLLPRWRGAAPIQRAIEAGDTQTGVTIMQMDAGLDTGAMLARQALAIAPTETSGELHDRLAALGAQLMVDTLAQARAGGLTPEPQPETGVCYAHKIDKAEAVLRWNQPAQCLVNRIRAFDPVPGAATVWRGEPLKIWAAELAPGRPDAAVVCGQILSVTPAGIAVAAMDSIVNITALQRPGGKRLSVAEFVRGHAAGMQPGQVLGA
ncbi:MAG: methionyl-tRNA formyltransferase [Rhodoferax sp.]